MELEPTLETLHQYAIEHVATKLHQKDLSSLSLASKSMKAKTNRPKLWRHINVSRRMIKQDGLPKLFSINKFKELRRIDLSNTRSSVMKLTAEKLIVNLQAVASSSVVDLNLEGVNIEKVPTALVEKLVSKLRKINLGYCNPSKEQCEALLQTCVSTGTLTSISFEDCSNLTDVPVELLVQALSKLTHVNLAQTFLKREQYLAIVEMCISSTSLVDVSLYMADLRDVTPQTLGQAAGRLTKIDLGWCYLSSEQTVAVINACVESPSLVDLSLWGVDLKDIAPQKLEQAVGRLTKISLTDSDLTSEQCASVINACIASSTLDHVHVIMSTSYLDEIPPQLLAKAVGNLKSVDFGYGWSTSEQSIAVLEKCKSSKLIDIDLSGADFSEVSPQLLKDAAGNLERMCLKGIDLTTDQSVVVLEACASSVELTKVSLSANLQKVPVNAILQAVRHLQFFDLENDKITTEQIIAILETVLTSTITVILDFDDNVKANLPGGLFIQAEETGRFRRCYDCYPE